MKANSVLRPASTPEELEAVTKARATWDNKYPCPWCKEVIDYEVSDQVSYAENGIRVWAFPMPHPCPAWRELKPYDV